MKISIIILTLIILCGCSSKKQNTVVSQSDWKQATLAFSKLNEVLKTENGQTWNHSLQGPLMLVNRESRVIIANEKDDTNELSKQGALYVGKLPENINIANTAFDWNGKQWTMVALPLPETNAERLSLLIHESFHRIQPIVGFDSIYEVPSVHLDTKDGRIYLKLEIEALKRALNTSHPATHIKNALLFRQYRYQLFPEAPKAENSLEILEGLAEYTGSILSQRSDSELKEHYTSQIDWFYTLPTFVRSFAYFTTPVYGYLMHQTDEGWNRQITKDTNLSEYLFAFFEVPQQVLTKEAIMQLGTDYGIDSIIDLETQREIKKELQKRSYRTTFLSDSVVVIGLEKMSIGFNPSNIMPLDSLGTVYPNLRITDNWGILEVDSCGALVSPSWDKVTISYPEIITDTLIVGRGWRLKLNDEWKLDKADVRYKMIKE
ncbi:hypothetical protein KDU71_15245 [Carboxylicivirga sediminis]|uniref:Uncharacterized protein n=1 Tax=Carboxylicivirga sediminis TaxID=2006564 RepID=A0A941F5U3_9BACT|nr:hypothetical protein [Carboxylicivirga sediminis]MBR8536927.1 hypothetical protein [Carboxylicivirga sediminis]